MARRRTQKAKAKEKILGRLKLVEDKLTGDYLMGGTFTPADAYLFVILRWAKTMHIDLSHLPRITAFKTRMEARAGVQKAMTEESAALTKSRYPEASCEAGMGRAQLYQHRAVVFVRAALRLRRRQPALGGKRAHHLERRRQGHRAGHARYRAQRTDGRRGRSATRRLDR